MTIEAHTFQQRLIMKISPSNDSRHNTRL